MDQIAPEVLQQRFKVVNFIGLSMIASVFLYALLVELLRRYGLTPHRALDPQIFEYVRTLLLIIAVGLFFLIRFLQKKLTQSLQMLFVGAVITYALSEAVAIYGLVLFLLSGEPLNFYIFMAISLFLFYYFYPRYVTWVRLLYSDKQGLPG